IASGFAPESRSYTVRLEAPVVAAGMHNLTLRLSVGGAVQEVAATFETAAASLIALGTPSRSADGSRIEVPIEALASLEALCDYLIEARSGGTSLPFAGLEGPLVIDDWQFPAGVLPLAVRVLVGDRAVSGVRTDVNVAALRPELAVDRRAAF